MRLMVVALLAAASSAVLDLHPVRSEPSRPELPLSVWRTDEAGGLEHLQSGLICPAGVGPYLRNNAGNFDRFGLDVACSYEFGRALITVYLTRRSGTNVGAALAQAKAELLQVGADRHPKLISEVQSAQGGLEWTVVLYEEDEGLHTSIWIADLDGWTVEYRVTYDQTVEARVLADLTTFTSQVRTTAGSRLDLCGRTTPPKRGGRPVSAKLDQRQATLMTSLLGATALVVSTEGQGESSTPVIWCPEDVREVDGHAFMFWRGVDSKGADALTDKVSALTLSQPPTLFAAPDPGDLINSFANGGGKRPRWAATLQDSQQTLIFGFFNGRPPSTALSDLLSAAISGKAQPIGAFGANGKDISVTARPRD